MSCISATAAAPVPTMRRSASRTSAWVTHGSSNGTAPRAFTPWHPGLAIGPTPRGIAVLARYFRESHSFGDPGGETPPTAAPVSQAPAASCCDETGISRSAAGSVSDHVPQSNAVTFVPSTRQRHQHHTVTTPAQRNVSDAASAPAKDHGVGGADSLDGREEMEAYVGPDEAIRRRAQVLRQEMFRRAEHRAIGLHPSILAEDLAAEATIPYDAAGSVDPPPARGYEGEAAGSPSKGAGPHSGLVVESVDQETGGFTTSLPIVDPAYDDVGRAIREEHDPRGRGRHSSPLAAEVRARKAATAEDLRESILDSSPELQDTYRVFGIPHKTAWIRRGGAAGGTVAVSDEDVEALLEAVPFGPEGAVLAEGADLPPEEVSALADPLSPPSFAGGGAGADPLDAALDALEHREVLDLLESGAVAAVTASTDTDFTAIANVMPSPLAGIFPTFQPPGSNTPNASANASSHDNSEIREPRSAAGYARKNMPSGGSGGAAAAAAVGRQRARSASSRHRLTQSASGNSRARHSAPPAISYPPPFYHTSPDVPEEDLVRRHRRSRPRSRAVPSTVTAAMVVSAVRGSTGESITDKDAAPRQHVEVDRVQKQTVQDAAGSVDSARWVRQIPLYNTSPDVLDEDLARTAAAAPSSVPINATTAAAGDDATAAGLASASTHAQRSPNSAEGRLGGMAAEPKTSATAVPQAASRVGTAGKSTAQPQRSPQPPQYSSGDSRRLRSLGDVDRQFIDLDTVSGWDEQAHDLRTVMRSTMPKSGPSSQSHQPAQSPDARGASCSLQPQTIGIHGTPASPGVVAGVGGGGLVGWGGGDGGGRQPVTVLRVECVPSQTYGLARTAAVLAADGKLTLLARPTGPSPERVRAALKLLRMAPDSRDFETSAAEAAAVAAMNDERAAAATGAAVAAAMAAAGTPGMEVEAQLRPPSPGPSMDELDLQPGLILGQSEIDPAEVPAEPNFPLDSSWTERHDPHDPHITEPMVEVEGHMLGLQANMWHEDYDEVMGQIHDGQRSGWSEDAVNGVFDSDVY
ncbi:hypothetical protein Vretimale_16650 [Volvox reticuliferus]|uniref:Uncharacterized protein n=1 Tax=Volvox reticuliferus TaxID=1737510 RepID=A0A8J4GUI3_9CHLO|nr:hypothetical protein Vretifemale_17456 [Volvox reticuliferus]GIM13562.1 hypothetical protein Vretimale_16650 [Volvox reticuliferus]